MKTLYNEQTGRNTTTMKLYKAPEPILYDGIFSVFLAGSIEEGRADKWQDWVTAQLAGIDISIYNPRRDDWDSSWVQSIDNPQFKEQVEWELNALELADLILMYFDPRTKSPISLLEFGLYANNTDKRRDMIVCCPEGFWRKGNVDIVCERYKITQVPTIVDLATAAKIHYFNKVRGTDPMSFPLTM